ncbi:TlpA family protein disulfide reductase [Pontibacter qinzhouensis]|uniref:TlpA family protein disulfide reductase n=1 Tax=Pontibacter qinzhouensis TaxID=2603253 RepID=A0A5C8KAE9_9BACT|nr:TlpA disulfide reductase family protein [Pontibacter qinzhouensis]TXK48711.1 TlpA family protein disulfide reductase [Pontibacter qinzhouensis]
MKFLYNNTPIRLFLFLGVALAQVLTSCSSSTSDATTIAAGTWRAVLVTQGQQIPFLLEASEMEGKPVLYLINGEERILLDDIAQQGDSIRIGLHIFDADLIAKVEGDKMAGRLVKHDTPSYYGIPFTASRGQNYRFSENPAPATYNYAGKWEVTFADTTGKTTNAVGVFEQDQNSLTGTFLTETGDYRYLAGEVAGDKLALSAFDGNHVYLFTAVPADANSVKGEFFSGITGYRTWTATRNENAALTHADSLTFLKPGYDQLAFSFPNLEGKNVSLSDPKYKNKVVVVQLLGTWCPNCMDETQYLAPFHKENQKRGFEVIGLGFERSPEFEKAAARLLKMKERLNIGYELLVAGPADNKAAAEALPALNHVMSFPTTIIVDRKGKVRKIHTGFSGPGTGAYYEEWVTDFNNTIDKLLAEG